MKFLLDTHAWIWAVLEHPRLGRNARDLLRDLADGERVGLAAISLKEAAWLLARGKVEVKAASWPDWLREAASVRSLEIVPLTVDVAIESERLPEPFPTDPADRLIAATARVHDLTLVTADRGIRASSAVRTIW